MRSRIGQIPTRRPILPNPGFSPVEKRMVPIASKVRHAGSYFCGFIIKNSLLPKRITRQLDKTIRKGSDVLNGSHYGPFCAAGKRPVGRARPALSGVICREKAISKNFEHLSQFRFHIRIAQSCDRSSFRYGIPL